MKDQETKDKFVELKARGLSFARIAEELGVSKQTLITWSKEFEQEIAHLRAIELDALYDRFYLSKEKTIELFGERLKSIKEELEKRDLKELSTKELLALVPRYYSILKESYVEPDFRTKKEILQDKVDESIASSMKL